MPKSKDLLSPLLSVASSSTSYLFYPSSSTALICKTVFFTIKLSIFLKSFFFCERWFIRQWFYYQVPIDTYLILVLFETLSCLSLSYYFQEILRDKKLNFPGLAYFKWPFMITCSILIVFYIFLMVIFSVYRATDPLNRAGFFVTAAIFLVLIAFFVYGGTRVIKNLSRFKSKFVLRLTLLIGITSTGMLIVAITHFVIGVSCFLFYNYGK